MPDLSTVKDIAITLGGVIALITLFSGVIEYVRRNRQDRAENFLHMRRRFLETPQYREILDLLQANDPKLATLSIQEKRNFVGFLEEVALMTNSKLISKEVAHYMFGYYVLLTAGCDAFWEGLSRDSRYWSLFHQFARDMRELESKDLAPKELTF